jgi:hypothetical protein
MTNLTASAAPGPIPGSAQFDWAARGKRIVNRKWQRV